MLYDPKWELPSLAGLVAWLETKNPSEVYDYRDAKFCLASQYMTACGREPARVCGPFLDDEVFPGLWAIASGRYREKDWTFGAALERARATLASTESDQKE